MTSPTRYLSSTGVSEHLNASVWRLAARLFYIVWPLRGCLYRTMARQSYYLAIRRDAAANRRKHVVHICARPLPY